MEYPFYNRDAEIKELKTAFEKEVIKKKSVLAYIIQGRKKVGKTRLIEAFIREIESNVELRSDIQKFEVEKYVIRYSCKKQEEKPYQPFIRITRELRRINKIQNISIKVAQVGLAVFGVNDALNAIKKLADELMEDENKKRQRKNIARNEARVFNKYRRLIKRMGKKAPIIIVIDKAQWIDEHSLKLIRKLVSDEDPLWGMIILEEDDAYIAEKVQTTLNQLVFDGHFIRMNVSALDQYFPSNFLAPKFGSDFFTNEENEILYTRSEGCPGILIDDIQQFTNEKWLRYNDNKTEWEKVNDFEDKIKPASQKLIELIITMYEDQELSSGEMRTIRKMASMWNLSENQVTTTISIVMDIMDAGYKIIENMGPGIVSKNCFVVVDDSNNRYIVEYLKYKKTSDFKKTSRDFKHNHLIEATEVKQCNEGVLILWNYFEGKRARQVIIEAIEKHIADNLKKASEISDGLAELHRNEQVHGFIKPESIIKLNDGSYQLATFDISIFNHFSYDDNGNLCLGENIKTSDDINPDWENLHYLSPEQLENKKVTYESDVFSFGVLFYKSLTNRFPFHGRNKKEILDSIKNDEISFQGYLQDKIPVKAQEIIQKCLKSKPVNRYKSAVQLNKEIRTIDVKKSEPVPDPLPDPVPIIPFWKKYKKPILVLLLLLIVAFAGYYLFFQNSHFKKTQIVNNITVEVEEENYTNDETRIISSDIIQYLIVDDIMQSSDEKVLTQEEFNIIYPENRKELFIPEKEVKAKIINRDFNYVLELKVINNNTNTTLVLTSLQFNNPSKLLKGEITEITKKILQINKLNKSTFTNDWDAFIAFYKGEKAWLKLDKNTAKENFHRALSIDPDFVLARLRIADIYRYEGSNSAAIKTLKIIEPSLSELSKADSLRAIALEKLLSGNYREAIWNYNQILEFLPHRKEVYYDLAEAYFVVRDIDNAAKNYKKALDIDSNFTQAINHYAYCFTHKGKHQKALIHFKRYLELDSSANAFDSYGDGLMATGKLDSAEWAKRQGLKLDDELDYLYNSLNYIQVRRGEFTEAEENVNNYLKLQRNSDLVAEGLTNKSLIYFAMGDYQKSLDTCLYAQTIYDTIDLISRNHKMHWLLGQLYLKMDQKNKVIKEIMQMDSICQMYNIDQFNYNEIYKYYLHLKSLLCKEENNIECLNEIVYKFDNELNDKVKDWSSPFDLAYFYTEFGTMYSQLNHIDKAITLFNKALKYNPNFAMAHYHIANAYNNNGNIDMGNKHKRKFEGLWQHADLNAKELYSFSNN